MIMYTGDPHSSQTVGCPLTLTRHLNATIAQCVVSTTVMLMLLLLILIHIHNHNLIPTIYRHPIKLGNADDGCYPQEETNVQKLGVESYETFAAVLFTCFIALCCMVALLLYMTARRKNISNSLTSEMETRIKENDMYALSKIGKDSVYSYIVTDKVYGWFIALATIGIQVGILIFFMNSAEASLQNNSTAVQFTWLCPRDTDVCKDTSNLTDFGWICFSVLMFAKLGKDFISGCKLIYHSAKITHSFKSRIRYFFGGTCLCSITLFALYVSCCCCVLSCSFRRSFLHLIGTMYFCVSSISGQYRLQQGYSDKQYSDHFNCSRRSIRHGV